MQDTEDRVYDLADAAEAVLEQHPDTPDWTPSALARKAHISTDDAHRALRYLAAHQYVTAAGNGCRTRYALTASNRDNARRRLDRIGRTGLTNTQAATLAHCDNRVAYLRGGQVVYNTDAPTYRRLRDAGFIDGDNTATRDGRAWLDAAGIMVHRAPADTARATS